jgi:uncharacterized protein YecT (DUF1311 family)
MKAFLFAAALAVSLVVRAHADECLDRAMSQADMNACAAEAHTASDATLNTLSGRSNNG